MINAYSVGKDNKAVPVSDMEAAAGLVKSGSICWLDIESPKEEDYKNLVALFGVEPLTMKQIRNEAGVPRMISGPDLSFLCWYAPKDGAGGGNTRFTCLFSENLLITIREGRVPAIDRNLDAVLKEPEIISRGIGILLYNLLDAAVDDYFLIVDSMSDRVDDIEDAMFAKPGPGDVRNLFAVKRQMIDLRRIIAPEREVVNSLLRRELKKLESGTEAYFQDMYDHLVRVIDLIDTLRDVTSGAMQIYQATISNNLNAIMKQLTIIATIMMPLTLITGIFGMNLGFPGKEGVVGFWVVMVSITVIGLGMLLWFRRRSWL
jgi:magnesium transporter